jgi:hypothetical protein
MSTREIPILMDDYSTDLITMPPREKWWVRFAVSCAAAQCPYRKKLWPPWLRKLRGVRFEGRWYCEAECLKPLLEFRLLHLLSGFAPQKTRSHRLPLGLLLINRGAISAEQLREGLRKQRDAGGGRLGDWFRQMGAVDEQQLTAALGQQWGCPVFPLEQQTPNPAWSGLLPLPLLESARTVPVHASLDGRVLHLCFGDHLDHPLLYAVELMLGCRTVACVASEAKIDSFLRQLRRHAQRTETCFDTVRDPREMAWVICNYATQLQAVRVAVVRTNAHLWVRFYGRNVARDLLFRILPESAPALLSERFFGGPKAFSLPADRRKDGVANAPGPL